MQIFNKLELMIIYKPFTFKKQHFLKKHFDILLKWTINKRKSNKA